MRNPGSCARPGAFLEKFGAFATEKGDVYIRDVSMPGWFGDPDEIFPEIRNPGAPFPYRSCDCNPCKDCSFMTAKSRRKSSLWSRCSFCRFGINP